MDNRFRIGAVAVLYGLCMIGLAGCQDAGTGTDAGILTPAGAYTYTGYDSSGTVIAQGWLSIDTTVPTRVTGKWHLEERTTRTDIGLQSGDGTLEGSLQDTLLFVDLHPQMRDNNVMLYGRFSTAAYRGRWDWVTIIGVTNRGTFEAIRK